MTSIYCCGQRIIAADAAHDEHYANDLVARSGGLLEQGDCGGDRARASSRSR